jgi:hypothetical protein
MYYYEFRDEIAPELGDISPSKTFKFFKKSPKTNFLLLNDFHFSVWSLYLKTWFRPARDYRVLKIEVCYFYITLAYINSTITRHIGYEIHVYKIYVSWCRVKVY